MSQRRKIERELGFNRVTPDLLASVERLAPADRVRLQPDKAEPVAEPPKKRASRKADA